MSRINLGFVVAAALLHGSCVKAPVRVTSDRMPLLSRLQVNQSPAVGKTIDGGNAVNYLINFSTVAAAAVHANEIRAVGGEVRALDRDGRTLNVTAPSTALAALQIPVNALAAVNSPMHIMARAQSTPPDYEALAQELLTTKSVVGVDQLQARFPRALGDGIKVAVFDTGIDFGVEGLSQSQQGVSRLTSFFDLTGFGKVAPQVLAADVPQSTYLIDGKTLQLANIGAQRISAVGVLSELQLARAYLMPEGVDLNGNESTSDAFPFVVGVNRAGENSVWIDLNGDSIIDAASGVDEELTDYNATHKSLDTRRGPGSAGGRPLAVTLTSATDIQFHSIPEGHGTSCAIIIAGDGYANRRLTGMVPHAELAGFVLDTMGQDIYSVSEFLQMFLKARDLGVNGISISWGFATADLESARFVADFLDREITSQGIVIGIATGNEGPGVNSAAADDYVPRYGYGVGAMVPQVQAENVYGWVGAPGDTTVWYSSFGPTEGGRQMPDISSPIVTLVRGERAGSPNPFYGFSGTSSATPAFVGAAMALVSALKSEGIQEIDTRLLKLALQNSAVPIPGISDVRQGPGTVNVNAAYDIYIGLLSELKQAQADGSRRTPFAYEILAGTALSDRAGNGDGIHIRGFAPIAKTITLSLGVSSAALVDPSVFFEPLILEHASDFFTVPQIANLQAGGASIAVQFSAQKLAVPGSYMDSIKVRRASDRLVLATIPVVIEVPAMVNAPGVLTTVNSTLGAYDIWRSSVRLDRSSTLRFEGMVLDNSGGINSAVGIAVRAPDGHTVSETMLGTVNAFTKIDFETPELPAGPYELLLFRNFRRPAVLGDVSVTLAVRLSAAQVEAAERDGDQVSVAIRAYDKLAPAKAVLNVQGLRFETTLVWNGLLPRPAFEGTLELAAATNIVSIGLRQNALARVLAPMLHMEVSAIDTLTDQVALRGWVDVESEKMPLRGQDLAVASSSLKFLAYPNILSPQRLQGGDSIQLLAATTFEGGALTAEFPFADNTQWVGGQVAAIDFTVPGLSALPQASLVHGTIQLFAKDGALIGRIPLSL